MKRARIMRFSWMDGFFLAAWALALTAVSCAPGMDAQRKDPVSGPYSVDAENQKAWNLLLNNQVVEAAGLFKRNQGSGDPRAASEAFRGYGMCMRFMGSDMEESRAFFQGFAANPDTLIFMAGNLRRMSFERHHGGHELKQAKAILHGLVQNPTPLTSALLFEEKDRFLNDGEIDKAHSLLQNSGIIRHWSAIGPFPNPAGSGFHRAFAPESAISLDAKYVGMNGNTVSWNPLNLKSPSHWVFQQNHYPTANSILYFATHLESDRDQDLTLGFGASGSFKIFLNGVLLISQETFRNLGEDAYLKPIHLRKGGNLLLIKLGNENQYSNFMARLIGPDGKGRSDIASANPRGDEPFLGGSAQDSTPNPHLERQIRYLKERLASNPMDEDAATLLMDFYNTAEMNDQAEILALNRLKLSPHSALWRVLLTESLIRSHQMTRSEEQIKAAYAASPLCWVAWVKELSRRSATGSSESMLEFLEKSPKEFRTRKEWLSAKFMSLYKLNRSTEALGLIEDFQKLKNWDIEVARMLAILHKSQGKTADAVEIWRKFIAHEGGVSAPYFDASNAALENSSLSDAKNFLTLGLRASPQDPNLHLQLFHIEIEQKNYPQAMKHLMAAVELAPTHTEILERLGGLQLLMGDSAKALATFKKSTAYNYNDFASLDKIRELEGKKSLPQLLSLPSVDSLLKAASNWAGFKNAKGSLVAVWEDLFRYSNGAVRHRHFMVVHLPTTEAVNNWKEYSFSYNDAYQSINIERALTHKANGSAVDAELGGGRIVFKSLEPGDAIVLEWTLRDDYQGEMARQTWGNHPFRYGFPTFDARFRWVDAAPDSLTWALDGHDVTAQSLDKEGLRVREFRRSPHVIPERDWFIPRTGADFPSLNYTTFQDWSQISNWYARLTENKGMPKPILRALADSLFAQTTTVEEKISRMYRFVSESIAYSSLSFRQSGWIPQDASEVVAARLGDCKDKAALAKSLLALAGIPSDLVLVMTRDEIGRRKLPIGPNFNHCILRVRLPDGRFRFLDLTAPSLHDRHLPFYVQGAPALVAGEKSATLMELPSEGASDKRVVRTIRVQVHPEGSSKISVRAFRTGVSAASFRETYRFKSPSECKKELRESYADEHPEVIVDSIAFDNLEPHVDTLQYFYEVTDPRMAKITGNNAIVPVELSDELEGNLLPDADALGSGLDLSMATLLTGSYELNGDMQIPPDWNSLGLPKPVNLQIPEGRYSLTFERKGNRILYRRKADFDFRKVVSASRAKEVRDFLAQVIRSDETQLIFAKP